MKFWEYLTTPPVLEDEYANQILNLKISWEEVFNTVFFIVGLVLISPWYEIDSTGELHYRYKGRRTTRVPRCLKWGKHPTIW